ncbi:MAG: hypothetical protein B5M56_07980 [Desulfococcus sp. 4484_241]|nr:MAG: hypothetical protein B5M56_07980 [Desulfococcus sp. 4484_241]
MTINTVTKTDEFVPISNVLVSVSDKSGLEDFIGRMVTINPSVRIFSTGGTYKRIAEILGDRAGSVLTAVSDYTGQPETQGGLVKTLDFKIYLGLLTETYNESHRQDMERTGAKPIDMVVVNLYPFSGTVAKPDVTPEQARGNIDIGGPCMLRAAAKNFLRVAAVCNPADYAAVIDEMEHRQGALSIDTRFELAQKAFEHTATYDRAIADYLKKQTINDVRACYTM